MAVLCPFTPLHLVDFKSSALGKSYESGISAFVGKVFSEFWYSTIGQELWGGNKDYLLVIRRTVFPRFFLAALRTQTGQEWSFSSFTFQDGERELQFSASYLIPIPN